MKTVMDQLGQMFGQANLEEGGMDNLVEAVEAAALAAFIESPYLPSDMGLASQGQVEEHTGILFADLVDDLFVRVVLPAGWRKVRGDQHRVAQLLDQKDRIRASIFYKNTGTKRLASMQWHCFYTVMQIRQDKTKRFYTTVASADDNVAWFQIFEDDTPPAVIEEARLKANRWLFETYPNALDPFSYWT